MADFVNSLVQRQLDRIGDWGPNGPNCRVHRMSGEVIRVASNGSWMYRDPIMELSASGAFPDSLVTFLRLLADSEELAALKAAPPGEEEQEQEEAPCDAINPDVEASRAASYKPGHDSDLPF